MTYATPSFIPLSTPGFAANTTSETATAQGNGGNGGDGGAAPDLGFPTGAGATWPAASAVHVDSHVQPRATGLHRFSTRPSGDWPAAAAITLSFNSFPVPRAASAGPQQGLPGQDALANVAMEDWHALLSAVMARLRATVGESMMTLAQPPAQVLQGAGRLQTAVLECVLALDQLQGTLSHEFSRREAAEHDIRSAHAALLRAQVALAQSRGDPRRLLDPAPRDRLATLPDRGAFGKYLERVLASAAPHAAATTLLVIDLDGFEAINATHGGHVGAELLGVVGARLARAVRADDMVSRIGADEFACLIRGPVNPAQLRQLASKLFDVVAMPCVLGPHQLSVQPSIGMACCPADGCTAAVLLACADAAMLRAKREETGFALFNQPAPG